MSDENLDLAITVGDATFHANGPSEVVMQALAEFKGLAAAVPPPRKPKPKAKDDAQPADDAGADEAEATTPQTSAASKVPLPQFLSTIATEGNAKVATAIVAWAADHEGKPKLTAPEIKTYWKNTNVKVPANINRDVEKAQKQGWLIKDNSGAYAISGFGRTAIGLS